MRSPITSANRAPGSIASMSRNTRSLPKRCDQTVEQSPGERLAILAAVADEDTGHCDPPNGVSTSVLARAWPQVRRFATVPTKP